MNEMGTVIIIPDESQILLEEYKKEILKSHLEAFIDFSKKFQLGYNFTNDDYQYAPEQLARDGHLIIKTLKNQKTAIFYIPRVITNRQVEWFDYHKYDYIDSDLVGAFSINDSNEEADQIYGIADISKIIRKKNEIYRKEDEKNVGKKI